MTWVILDLPEADISRVHSITALGPRIRNGSGICDAERIPWADDSKIEVGGLFGWRGRPGFASHRILFGLLVCQGACGPLRQLRAHSVQGAVRIHETELSHSVVSVANFTETTLDSATGPFRPDGIGI